MLISAFSFILHLERIIEGLIVRVFNILKSNKINFKILIIYFKTKLNFELRKFINFKIN